MKEALLGSEFCYNHPKVKTVDSCSRCHEPKCHRCLRADGTCVECYLKEPIFLPHGTRRPTPFGPLGSTIISKHGFLGFVWDTTTLYVLCFLVGMAYLVIFALIWGL
jgi:hypothetical protein